MISECTNDLIDKLKSTSLGESVGATLGGVEADPAKAKLPTPFAWVVFFGTQNEGPQNRQVQQMRLSYRAILAMDYGKGETDYIDNKLGLIEEVTQAVRGTQGPQTSSLWQFDGGRLVKLAPSRVLFELTFSIVASYKST